MNLRAGGQQVIPRPPTWTDGGPAPWAGLPDGDRHLDLATVIDRVTTRGPAQAVQLGPAPPEARRSAVLIALFDDGRGPEVILTRRSQGLSNHRGEVSLPGGRCDEGETPEQTALREAWEEIALDPSTVTMVGELDLLYTYVSRSLIAPVVGVLDGRPALVPAASEVDRIFTVPLDELLRPDTFHAETWAGPPFARTLQFFELDDETIWGATGRILLQLLEVALGLPVEPGPVWTALVDEHVSAGPYTLRPWVPADLPWVHDACQDPEIRRFTRLPRPYRAPHALALLEASRAGRADGSAYRFAVVRTDSDELLGAVAVAVGDGGIGGWVVWEARRQGVARTVLAALAQWSAERLGLDSVGLTLAVTNDAGRRAAEGAGFGWVARRPGEASDDDRRVDAVVYRHAGR